MAAYWRDLRELLARLEGRVVLWRIKEGVDKDTELLINDRALAITKDVTT